jgi:hypothetical protein
MDGGHRPVDRPPEHSEDDARTRTPEPVEPGPHDPGSAGRPGPQEFGPAGQPGPHDPGPAGGQPRSEGLDRQLTDVVEAVLEATTRDAAERAACSGLVAPGRYRRAWVGERALDGQAVAVRTVAETGADLRQLDAAAAPTVAVAAEHPLSATLRDGDRRVFGGGALDADRWPGTTQGLDGDVVAAVPLGHDGTTHGVLAVHARGPKPFGEPGTSGLGTLGTALGRVLDAVRSRRLLFADAVVELSFRCTDVDSPLVAASREHGCTVAVDGYVATGGRWLVYCDVDGAAVDAVAGTLDGSAGVEECRVISERPTGGRLEVTTAGTSLLDATATAGATLRTAVAEGGVCRLTVEVPQSTETRESVARLKAAEPDMELLACRELDRPPADPSAPAGLLAELTDRQREVLEVLYRAGYFEWPRESTAQEVADRVGIDQSTLQGHLRKAEHALVSELLD